MFFTYKAGHYMWVWKWALEGRVRERQLENRVVAITYCLAVNETAHCNLLICYRLLYWNESCSQSGSQLMID